MKDIDFLPEWYKSGRRRQISYRTQYVALGGIFAVMMVWNFGAAHSVSKAMAELDQETVRQVEAEKASREFSMVKSKVTELLKRAGILKDIDSRLDMVSVLGEMSFLTDKKIVLSKLEFKGEKFPGDQTRRLGRPLGSAVRVVSGDSAGRGALPLGDARFRVLIEGVAADTSDVAELVCKLEDSPYFFEVTSSWQNRKILMTAESGGEKCQVSAFEISCYLANYRQEETN